MNPCIHTPLTAISTTTTKKNYNNNNHHNHHHQKNKKWRRKKKKRAAAAAAASIRGTHVKQCVGGMVMADVMAALVASEHVHTIVRKHVKRMDLPSSSMTNNNTTVTAAIFGHPSLPFNEQQKSTKKTRKSGLGSGVSVDGGANNNNGGTSNLSGVGVSTIQSLRQVIGDCTPCPLSSSYYIHLLISPLSSLLLLDYTIIIYHSPL